MVQARAVGHGIRSAFSQAPPDATDGAIDLGCEPFAISRDERAALPRRSAFLRGIEPRACEQYDA